MNQTIFANTINRQKMSKGHNPNSQISIADLSVDAVESSLSYQEQYLTTEECQNIIGGWTRICIRGSGEDAPVILCFYIPRL